MEESKQAELLKVLSVESRIKILDLLRHRGPLGVNEMAQALSITPSAVSQHLKILRLAGLVRSERKGYCLPYHIDHAALSQCKELLAEECNCGCKGTCRAAKARTGGAGHDLATLTRRERELQRQLADVRAQITKMKGKA